MELKNLLVDTKTTWVEFPGLDGFEVELANLSRKELVALRKKCTQQKFNRKTRAFEETLDEISTLLISSKIDLSSSMFFISDLIINLNLYRLGQDEDSVNCFSNLL